MLATFEGRVENGQLTIPELGKALKVLEGKRVAITSLKANRNGELAGGQLIAGVWKKAHAPEKLLRWVERFHAWHRG